MKIGTLGSKIMQSKYGSYSAQDSGPKAISDGTVEGEKEAEDIQGQLDSMPDTMDEAISEIIKKYMAGGEITCEEKKYLKENAPGTYRELEEELSLQEQLEASMKQAETKEAVTTVALACLSSTKKQFHAESGQALEPEKYFNRINKLSKTITEYKMTEEYHKKEDVQSEAEKMAEEKDRPKEKEDQTQNQLLAAAVSYQKGAVSASGYQKPAGNKVNLSL